MSAMEKSLRRALEAGDAADPAFRESIYAASERALERMLDDKGADETVSRLQRTRLAETINRIEDEFYARQTAMGAGEDGPAQHDPALSLDPAYADAHAYSTYPDEAGAARRSGERLDADDFDVEPVYGGDGLPEAMAAHGTGATTGPERFAEPVRPSVRQRADAAADRATARTNLQQRRILLILGALAVAIGLASYFAYSAGLIGGGAAQTDTSWIDIFDGRRLQALATPGGGRMEALGEGAPAVRFTPADAASVLAVAIGPGVLPTIDGRRVRVEIVAGAPGGKRQPFAVACTLGGQSVCGEQLFTATERSELFAFDMTVPRDAGMGRFEIAPRAGEGGAAAGSLDLYSVRLRNS